MNDYGTSARRAFIDGTVELTPEARTRIRLERAKAELGSKYVCHPANRVQRLAVPLVENGPTVLRGAA